jgi:hypothetical protein
VERSHDVSFHVADFPGVSIFAPTNPSFQSNPLASPKFMEHEESPNPNCTNSNSPPPSSQDVHYISSTRYNKQGKYKKKKKKEEKSQ